MPVTPRNGRSSARFIISGYVSTGASWIEQYSFQVDGAAIADADTFEWQFNFRTAYGDAPSLSLSTTDGTLTITQGADSTTIAISVPYSSLSSLEGDYIADLAYTDGSSNRFHWAHGTVTFRNEPIWSD